MKATPQKQEGVSFAKGSDRNWCVPDSVQLAVSLSQAKVKEWSRDCRNYFFAMESGSGFDARVFWRYKKWCGCERVRYDQLFE